MGGHGLGGITRVAAALALSLSAAACGSSAAPPAAPTAVPTAAVTAAPTAAIEALTETLTATSGGRSVRYPAGWVGTDNLGILYVVSSMDANDRLVGTGKLKSGDVFIQFGQNSILSGGTSDPMEHLPQYLELLASNMGMTLPAPVAITAAGFDGARVDASSDKVDMMAISLRVSDERFADIIAYVPLGELAAREALVLAIVDTLAYPTA